MTESKKTDENANALIEADRGPMLKLSGPVSPAMQIMTDDRLFERTKLIAKYMSAADGFLPPHLIGKTEACFAVVMRAFTWKLDPYAVAQCTYQTPGGRVGFEGKLCQAILENSGKLVGPVKYEFFGDWSRIEGRFAIKTSDKGKQFAVPTWTREDAKDVGVIVRAQVRGELEPREWTFRLAQAFPLNSTLWATDPRTQICYTAVRRFGSVAAPGLFMGVPFDASDIDDSAPMRDVTPRAAPRRPTQSDFEPSPPAREPEPEPEPQASDAAIAEAQAAERRMEQQFAATISGQMPDDEPEPVEPAPAWSSEEIKMAGGNKPKPADAIEWARAVADHVKKAPSAEALAAFIEANKATLNWFRGRFNDEADTLVEIINERQAALAP